VGVWILAFVRLSIGTILSELKLEPPFDNRNVSQQKTIKRKAGNLVIVCKAPHGEFKCGEIQEVSSLEDFAARMNENLRMMGLGNYRYYVISKTEVEFRAGGVIEETYHACEKNPFRLV